MVVCKFFQQGNCRNGQNCRFDHIYGSKYSYYANPPAQATSLPTNTITDEQLMNQVQTDVQSVLKGGQWILSWYAPFKDKPVFPGLPDLSPEEARLFIYEAKANNNVDEAVAYMNNLFKETTYKYQMLMQPNINIKKVLQSLYKGEQVPSPFTNTTQLTSLPFGNNSTEASSLFRSAVQNPSGFSQNNANTSIFSQQPSNPFGQSSDAAATFAQAVTPNVFGSNQTPSVFGASTSGNAKSIFAQASQNIFSTNENKNASNLFASASQNFFGSQDTFQQNSSPFSNPGNIIQNTEKSVFAITPNTNVFQQPKVQDAGVYSKMEDLSPDDLESFKSDNFKLGFVPEIAPPQSLCI